MQKALLICMLACSAIALAAGRNVRAGGNPCTKPGFFALVDNTPEYYGCYRNSAGGLHVRYLTCPANHVFSSGMGYCVPSVKAAAVESAADAIAFEEATTLTPEEPENPEVPEKPEEPENPEVPEKPEEPENPEVPEKPEEPEGPENPETTEAPDTEPSSTEEGSGSEDTTTESPEDPETTPDGSTDETTEEPDTTAGPETTDDGTETTDDGSEPFRCPSTGFFPSPEGCNKFIYCGREADELVAYNLQCPEGQQFNFIERYCDADFDCYSLKAQRHSETEREIDCVVEGTFPHESDCATYYTCKWNVPLGAFEYQRELCRENEVFDKLTGRCGKEDRLTCRGRPVNSRFEHF